MKAEMKVRRTLSRTTKSALTRNDTNDDSENGMNAFNEMQKTHIYLSEAAMKYNVPKSTLSRRISIVFRIMKRGRKATLNEQE